MSHRLKIKCYMVLLAFFGFLSAHGDELALAQLDPVEFLQEVRRPFRLNSWGRLKGRITTKGTKGSLNEDVWVALRFGPSGMKAQLILSSCMYGMSQCYTSPVPDVEVELPIPKGDVSLSDFGVRPEDFTFSFLCWDLDEELPGQKVRGQACRVLRLVHPRSGEVCVGWFSAKYGFPLKVCWYTEGAGEPYRYLEFTNFRKYEGGIWFAKNVRLNGDGWKTRITFAEVEVFDQQVRPEPSGLFSVSASLGK